MAKLIFVTPRTLEEMKQYQKDVHTLQCLIPFPHWSQAEPNAFLEASEGELTLIYLEYFLNHWLVGSFLIEQRPRQVSEIHGSVNPLIKNTLGKHQSRKLLNNIYELLFHRLFIELHQRAIVAKVHTLGKGSLGFVRHYGFQKVHSQGEESIWVLSLKHYLKRDKGSLYEQKKIG